MLKITRSYGLAPRGFETRNKVVESGRTDETIKHLSKSRKMKNFTKLAKSKKSKIIKKLSKVKGQIFGTTYHLKLQN